MRRNPISPDVATECHNIRSALTDGSLELWNLFFTEDAQPATIALSTASIRAGHSLYVLLYQRKDSKCFLNSFRGFFFGLRSEHKR